MNIDAVETWPRRVLVVAYDFPPHAAIGTMRTLRVVRQLHQRGWDVTVLTSDPSGFLPTTPVDGALMDKVPIGVRVVRAAPVRPWERTQTLLRGWRHSTSAGAMTSSAPADAPAPARPRNHLLRRAAQIKDIFDAALSIPDRECGWVLPALGTGLLDQLRAHPPDVIYSSAPPWTGQLVAAGLKQVLRRPWVADFRDPWARAPWRGDRYRFALRAAAILERFVVRRADRVVFVAAGNRDDFAAAYGPTMAGKFDVVPNGCDPEEFEGLADWSPRKDGAFVLLHAGSLYGGRTPVPLLKAIAAAVEGGIIDRRGFRLRLLGSNGFQPIDLFNVARQLGIEEMLEVAPRVPREDSIRAMRAASALLLLQPGHTVSVPGKVYEYLAAGRPILAIAEEGETAEIVRGSGIGISVRPEQDLVGALSLVMQMGRSPVAPPPRELFDGNVTAGHIASILERVAVPQTRTARAPGAAGRIMRRS